MAVIHTMYSACTWSSNTLNALKVLLHLSVLYTVQKKKKKKKQCTYSANKTWGLGPGKLSQAHYQV